MPPKSRKRAISWYTDQHRPGVFDPAYKRHWPRGHLGSRSGLWVMRITCEEPYVSRWVLDGTHEPLTLSIADRRGRLLGWSWVEVGSGYRTLLELKEAAEVIFKSLRHMADPSSCDTHEVQTELFSPAHTTDV